MKVVNLILNSDAYLVIGDFNSIDYVNTLIDTGRDSKIMDRIWKASTGMDKKELNRL